MLSAGRLVREPAHRSVFLIQDPDETGLVHQIVGGDPAVMGRAAAILVSRGVTRVDVNMGCSAPALIAKGQGVALMREPDRARAVVAAVRRAFGGHLSAKIRLGWAERADALPDFCRMLAAEGVQTLTLHPRWQHEKFRGRARWDWIPRVREWAGVPVVGNGDVQTPADAHRLRAETGCDGIMIGRGAAMRPGLFRAIADPGAPAEAPAALLSEFIELMERYLPPERRLSRLKIFTHWFAQPLPFGHSLRSRVQAAPTLAEARARIDAFFAHFSEDAAAAGPAGGL
jgi:tRNA-dihydrouridine synthase